MISKDLLKAIVTSAAVACVFLIANLLLLQFTSLKTAYVHFVYPVQVLYLLYFVFTIIILFALYKISAKSPAQTGYVFLGLTSLKVVGSYFVANPIISKTIDASAEKVNLLFVFLLFLTLEAYFTAKLLNKN